MTAFTLAAAVHSELVIKKSRFVGCVQPIPDRAAALAVVAALRHAHPGATHVCWALMAGGQSAANDDGEPGGTAGRPMMEVLRHQQLEGVLATVVRYFSGVKLGAGGLLRAYTDAVARALLAAERLPLEPKTALGCKVPYALEGALRRELDSVGAELIQVQHRDAVALHFSVKTSEAKALVVRLGDVSQGRIEWIDADDDRAADQTDNEAPQRRQ
ncbi:IMPACT family protein [soil metagenome]